MPPHPSQPTFPFGLVRAHAPVKGLISGVALVLALLSCEQQKQADGVTVQAAAPAPKVCASGGQALSDPKLAALVPRALSGYCLDPNDEPRSYGEDGSRPLERICQELFNDECQRYESYGLLSVVSLRYVDATGSPGFVSLNLLRFASEEGAFAAFTQRVTGLGDVSQLAAQPLEVPGQAALGEGIARVWRGTHVAELTYDNPAEAPTQHRTSTAKLLPAFARDVAERLKGAVLVPDLVRLLPTQERYPFGLRLEFRDALGVAGAGAAALGYYARGQQRYVVLVGQHVDEDAAKDVQRTLRRQPGAKRLKDMPFGAFELEQMDPGPLSVWLFGRLGSRIAGVGDDPFAFADASTDAERKLRALSRAEKLRLLGQVLRARAE